MPNFNFKQVNDAIHGVIGISELESDIISTPAFQRLHNVKQLGLAFLIFPGANYSRFSHSVGACHLAGRMLDAIQRNCNRSLNDKQIQEVRVAALLHDVGHYPFSHVLEKPIKNHYSKTLIDKTNTTTPNPSKVTAPRKALKLPPPFYDHEGLGGELVELSADIKEALEKHGHSGKEISSLLLKQKPSDFVSLISADLDCDRLDYLSRTAHYAGVPYGKVDVEYIINQMTMDENNRVCINKRGLKAADHFLIARYYDYNQTTFHKTLSGIEIFQQDIVLELLERGLLKCSGQNMHEKITNQSWANFDDHYLMEMMRNCRKDLDPTCDKDKPLIANLDSILNRHPPKLLASSERVSPRSDDQEHKSRVQLITEKLPQWSNSSGIEIWRWKVWEKDLPLTSMGAKQPSANRVASDKEEEGLEEMKQVRVLGGNPRKPKESIPLVKCNNTLIESLSQQQFYGIRVYVNFAGWNGDMEAKRSEIKSMIFETLPHFHFS